MRVLFIHLCVCSVCACVCVRPVKEHIYNIVQRQRGVCLRAVCRGYRCHTGCVCVCGGGFVCVCVCVCVRSMYVCLGEQYE